MDKNERIQGYKLRVEDEQILNYFNMAFMKGILFGMAITLLTLTISFIIWVSK